MQTHFSTTPFGRRPLTLALVKGQLEAAEMRPGKSADKWRVFRDICEARGLLGLQDRPLAVLNALLTFFPESELAEGEGLVVFPSNAQLSVRAHGISGSTLRRSLAALVDAGLIHRRDSPNGKRYAHRDRSGQIEDAFGFSLAPLLARAEEFATLAQQAAEETRQFRRLREALTLSRRDVRKMISAGLEEGADGDWEGFEDRYVALVSRLPRQPGRFEVEALLGEMELLRAEVLKTLENQLKAENKTINDSHDDCLIQNSNTESIIDLEPCSENGEGARARQEPQPQAAIERKMVGSTLTTKAFPLALVLKACPQIADYGPDGAVSNWRDLMAAAVVVRSTLGVSPSAYQEACEAMGPENAAVTMACILERAGHIHSAGGYLRGLTAKARRGEYSPGPALMALLRTGGGERRLA